MRRTARSVSRRSGSEWVFQPAVMRLEDRDAPVEVGGIASLLASIPRPDSDLTHTHTHTQFNQPLNDVSSSSVGSAVRISSAPIDAAISQAFASIANQKLHQPTLEQRDHQVADSATATFEPEDRVFALTANAAEFTVNELLHDDVVNLDSLVEDEAAEEQIATGRRSAEVVTSPIEPASTNDLITVSPPATKSSPAQSATTSPGLEHNPFYNFSALVTAAPAVGAATAPASPAVVVPTPISSSAVPATAEIFFSETVIYFPALEEGEGEGGGGEEGGGDPGGGEGSGEIGPGSTNFFGMSSITVSETEASFDFDANCAPVNVAQGVTALPAPIWVGCW